MRARFHGIIVFLCFPAGVLAQQQPVVEVVPVIKGARPHLPPQRVGVGDCYGVPAAQQTEELATIKVSLAGPSERTAEHLAKEKAGEIGANCLFPLSAAGEDNMRGPAQRSYKAFRVLVPWGAYQIPASPGELPAPPKAPSGSFQSTGFRVLQPPPEHTAHLAWAEGNGAQTHEVVIDASRTDPAVWADIVKDAAEYFPEPEYARLIQAGKKGSLVGIDLVNFRITVPDAGISARQNPW